MMTALGLRPVYVYVYGEKTKTGGRVIRQAQFLTRTRSQVLWRNLNPRTSKYRVARKKAGGDTHVRSYKKSYTSTSPVSSAPVFTPYTDHHIMTTDQKLLKRDSQKLFCDATRDATGAKPGKPQIAAMSRPTQLPQLGHRRS